MVHVGRAKAYEAFSDGLLLFDITPNAELLRMFVSTNESEFGMAFEMKEDGSFKSMNDGHGKIFYTYHKHKAREKMVSELQQIEREQEHE